LQTFLMKTLIKAVMHYKNVFTHAPLRSFLSLGLGLFWALSLSSCLDSDTPELIDDDPAIQEFIQNNNLNAEKLPSGIYKVELLEGNGRTPELNEVVEMAVDLRLLDGTSFLNVDSYVFEPGVGSFIPALAIASLSLEDSGSYRLIVPSALAYGPSSGTLNNVFVDANSIIQAYVTMNDVRTFNEQFQFERNFIEEYIEDNQLDTLGAVTYEEEGLYKILISEGDTAVGKPGEFARITVAYEGQLTDGTVFDSSESATFTLSSSSLINGFYRGLRTMNSGEKALLLMTSNVAYGNRGTNNGIPPFSPLIFEVELISF